MSEHVARPVIPEELVHLVKWAAMSGEPVLNGAHVAMFATLLATISATHDPEKVQEARTFINDFIEDPSRADFWHQLTALNTNLARVAGIREPLAG